jgi:hypothetical protein
MHFISGREKGSKVYRANQSIAMNNDKSHE